MIDKRRPEWIKNAPRVDRPDITRWFKPEDGPINGTLIWRGRQEHHQSGDVYNVYAIREADTGLIIGVSERAGLRDLRRQPGVHQPGRRQATRQRPHASAVRDLRRGARATV